MRNNLSSPLDICVLIPCYNNEEGLIKSIRSINYNKQSLLVLVVDDGSSEPVSQQTLNQHLPYTFSIEVIRLSENRGIVEALNKGLAHINAYYNQVKYIARLDCGDVCHSDRFSHQAEFLNKHKYIDLVGSWCYFEDPINRTAYEYRTPIVHDGILRSMYFRNVFVHPTVMWRKAVLNTYRYPEKYPHAEDYGLFYDITSKRKTAILPEFLVTCEINQKGISFLHRQEQLKSRLKIVKDFGANKLLTIAGVIKMAVLIALPSRYIYFVKSRLYKHKP